MDIYGFGWDFGTTNSLCCYYKETDKKNFKFLKFDKQNFDFFPTMIAYQKDNDKIRYIGEAARRYQFSSKFDVYENFKLHLGRNAKEKNGRRKSPYEAALDFTAELIRKFEEISGGQIGNVVTTIPDVWKNEEKNKIAVDNLAEIYKSLGFEMEGDIAFESEPVSAAAYYCYEICGGEYSGNLLVVDSGGGTLDLSLCRVEEDPDKGGLKITVLRRCGDGGSGEKGCAGVAFDNAMTHRLVKKYGLDETEYCPEGRSFANLRLAFEDAKIASKDSTREALSHYYAAYDSLSGESDEDETAFIVSDSRILEEDYEVNASDLAEVFREVNEDALTNALSAMKEYTRELDVDTDSQEHFRVLMVGGFSNLYCVESRVREVFGSLDNVADQRFDNGMGVDARTTAIAQGAAIIASGMAKVDHLCPETIGFCCYDACSESEQYITVIERDKPVEDYREPVYFKGYLRVNSAGKKNAVRLFFDGGSGKVIVRMDETFSDMCPNVDDPDNLYNIGFSMNKMIPMIHVRDKNGAVNSQSLNQVREKIALQLIVEGGNVQ